MKLSESSDDAKALLKGLRADDPERRASSARTLGLLGDTWSLTPLLDGLGDLDGKVRLAAAEGLRYLGEPIWELAVRGDDEDWARLAHQKDPRVVGALVTVLKSDRANARRAAAAGLEGQEDERAVEPLLALLTDPDRSVRVQAVQSLGTIGSVGALPGLLDALKDSASDVREKAAMALGRLGDATALGALHDAAADQDPSVGRAALVARGQLGDGTAVAHLVRELTATADHRVAARVASALAGMNAWQSLRGVLADQGAGRAARCAAANALGESGDSQAVEQLIVVLADSDGLLRADAARALSQLQDSRSLEPLLSALSDELSLVRERAAEALGKLSDRRATPPLLELLRRANDSSEKEAIVSALAELADERATDILIEALKVDRLCIQAAAGLGRIGGPQAIDALLGLLGSPDPSLRGTAAIALASTGNSAAVEPILEAQARSQNQVSNPALVAIGIDTEATFRCQVALALGALGDARAIDSLGVLLATDKSASVRAAAAKALGATTFTDSVEQTLKLLRKAQGDRDPNVRVQADAAVAKLS